MVNDLSVHRLLLGGREDSKRRTIVRKSSIGLMVMALVVAVAAAVLSSSLVASAQNSNSSTVEAPPAPKAKTKHRAKPAAPATSGRCDPMQQEQTDLSGTYTGKLKHGDSAVMDATLTVTGNTFTMTNGTETHSGRITAVTTCGYTAVTIMAGDLTPPDPTKPAPPPLETMSLRAKKVGKTLTLTSVAGEKQQVSFVAKTMP